MLNWLKKIFAKLKGAKPIVGDVGLVNVKPEFNADIKGELKFADKQENKLVEVNNIDNSQQLLQQNFVISILPNINVDDAIKKALTVGNENANLVGIDVQKLLASHNISQEQVKENLCNPEMLYTIAKANEIAYKTSDIDKRKILSDLIFNKIKEDIESEESKILSLAIQEMDILNIDHIKALAFLHIMKSFYLKDYSFEDFKEFEFNILKQLLSFKNSNIVNIGKFLSSTRTIADAHVGWDIMSYLPQIFKKIDSNTNMVADEYIYLSKTWNDLGFIGAYITPVGKYIAKEYLYINFGILVDDIKTKENSTKNLADDVSASELSKTLEDINKNQITFEEIKTEE